MLVRPGALMSGPELAGPSAPLNPPINTAAPVITGTTKVGQTLTIPNGTWSNSPSSFARQWLRDGVAISGATGSTYVLVSGDAAKMISCRVTATNADGSGSVTATAVGPIVASNPPVNTVEPVISGTVAVGSTLTIPNGTWSNSPSSYARQWLRNGANISGATATTYALVAADQGATISCRVTATNADGSTAVTSATVGPVPDATLNAINWSDVNISTPNPTGDQTVAATVSGISQIVSLRATITPTSREFYAAGPSYVNTTGRTLVDAYVNGAYQGRALLSQSGVGGTASAAVTFNVANGQEVSFVVLQDIAGVVKRYGLFAGSVTVRNMTTGVDVDSFAVAAFTYDP